MAELACARGEALGTEPVLVLTLIERVMFGHLALFSCMVVGELSAILFSGTYGQSGRAQNSAAGDHCGNGLS